MPRRRCEGGARQFEWPAGRQGGKTREYHDADGQRQAGKTFCRVSVWNGLSFVSGEGARAKCRE